MNHRKQDEWEREVLAKLVESSFSGRDQLEAQLKSAVVRTINRNGSIEISPLEGIPAPVLKRVPVEAECIDSDGVRMHILLHVVDGMAKELEIYKEDGSELVNRPKPSDLDVFVLPP